jgi:hypothetical protein
MVIYGYVLLSYRVLECSICTGGPEWGCLAAGALWHSWKWRGWQACKASVGHTANWPEPALGIPKCLAREAITTWTIDQHHRHWRDVPGHKHDKLFISGPCNKRTEDLLKLSSHQLRMVVAILKDMLLWERTYVLWAYFRVILSANSADRRLK